MAMKHGNMKYELTQSSIHYEYVAQKHQVRKLIHNLPYPTNVKHRSNTHTQSSIHYDYEAQKHEARTLTHNRPYTTFHTLWM